MTPTPDSETPEQILLRIDREIQDLLKLGKLSRLDYAGEFPPNALTDRGENLKALLAVRRLFRKRGG